MTIGLLPAMAPLSLECFLFPDQALLPGRGTEALGPRASLPALLMLLCSAQHKFSPTGEISFLPLPIMPSTAAQQCVHSLCTVVYVRCTVIQLFSVLWHGHNMFEQDSGLYLLPALPSAFPGFVP